MKKKFLLGCILMICLFMVTGCGASKSNVGTESVPDAEDKSGTQETTLSEEPAETVTIYPLPVTINMEQLDNCTVAISLNKGDVYADDTGVMRMKVKVYVYDLYDMVDIAQLEEGDTINPVI